MKGFLSNVKASGGFDPVKVRANIRMATTRLGMQKNKLLNSVKMQRRGVAELLALEKYDSARIRVESCIRDDVNIEGYEVLSLFLDLLANRVQLIAESKALRTSKNKKDPSSACPPELKEAITSVLWASARIGDSVPELTALRKYFELKFGHEFVEMSTSNAEFSVNQRMMERLGMYAPPNDKCIAYLTSIAKEFQLTNYNEERLRDPNGLVASAAAASGGGMLSSGGAELSQQVCGSVRTPSGLYIPPMQPPYDAIDQRLLQLMCV
ncbi:Regulator of Vps4 activity in the MVB pathway, putative [Leishmania lindenbergi]|uniref:Regulator of Vps4 activity in the MVB pathway n=1 Tax=Leishmania lindenbergi TaxID=651832 RepID=A0AAW3AAR2_9TRYP